MTRPEAAAEAEAEAAAAAEAEVLDGKISIFQVNTCRRTGELKVSEMNCAACSHAVVPSKNRYLAYKGWLFQSRK